MGESRFLLKIVFFMYTFPKYYHLEVENCLHLNVLEEMSNIEDMRRAHLFLLFLELLSIAEPY